LNAFVQRNLETARKAFRAGVRFAMGSDAVYTMFGENTRELGWFVKAGMTPRQALETATINGAHLLGMADGLRAPCVPATWPISSPWRETHWRISTRSPGKSAG
jgi:cytosine/adenosine deaminase-related metal-dependent hydrolase